MENIDSKLKEIPGLKWLPWIGSRYAMLENRVMVLGESHYMHDGYSDRDINYTQDVVREYVEGGSGNQKNTYEPIEKILRGALFDDECGREEIWNSIAYMNIIQRILKFKSGKKQWSDFLEGWKVVLRVIGVIRPRAVISFSSDKMHNRANFNRLQEFENEFEVAYAIEKNCDSGRKIGNVHVAKPGAIAFADSEESIPVIFIQHASRIRRFDAWRSVLKEAVASVGCCDRGMFVC